MTRLINPWNAGAIAFCAIAWALIGFTGSKLTNVYATRGPQGFRYALGSRLDHRLHAVKALLVREDGRSV